MSHMSDESLKMITGNEPPLEAKCDGCACRDDRLEELQNALDWVMPMAKGFAAEHPVGRNDEIVAKADAIRSPDRNERKSDG